MKAAKFDYVRPSDLQQAVSCLEKAGVEGRVLAGGQSLVPMLNLRLAQPGVLVDLMGLSDLQRVEAGRDSIVFGACVTHASIEDGSDGSVLGNFLAKVAGGIGYRGIRNLGTLGGSLAHADPAADWPAALLALGATVQLLGPKGRRSLGLEDFVLGPFSTALEPGEILEAVTIPTLSDEARCGYCKISQKVGDFAAAIGVVVVDPLRDWSRTVIGATNSHPVVLQSADGDPRAAVERECPDFMDYEARIHGVAASRALAQAAL